jgi:hypothetical protein
VECVGGDLTIKVEDNTATGEGIYSEPVDDRHQKVDDAEIAFAELDHLILLKIRPYKETAARYFIFNEKLRSVVRVDSIGDACVRLPEEHGLIFPDGYYLGTGELKRFDAKETGLVLERVVHSPNGEDSLYVFYGRASGEYVLLPYRLIEQKVEERIACHGFALFPNGQLILFRADDVPQKHHQIQLRQTPFYQLGHEPAGQKDTFLYQVGNKDVVRCLAECNEVLTLAGKETPYAELYSDLVRRCTAMLDAYPWLASADGFQINDALQQLRHQLLAALRRLDALEAKEEVEHLRAVERWIEAEVLRQVAQAAPHRTRVLHDVHAVERDAAARGLEQAAEDVHERALAGAVGAEQSEQALRDVERHALQRGDGTGVDLDEVSDLEHCDSLVGSVVGRG